MEIAKRKVDGDRDSDTLLWHDDEIGDEMTLYGTD